MTEGSSLIFWSHTLNLATASDTSCDQCGRRFRTSVAGSSLSGWRSFARSAHVRTQRSVLLRCISGPEGPFPPSTITGYGRSDLWSQNPQIWSMWTIRVGLGIRPECGCPNNFPQTLASKRSVRENRAASRAASRLSGSSLDSRTRPQ